MARNGALNLKIAEILAILEGAWAIGHAPTQISYFSKFCAPPVATSHSGGTFVDLVVIVVGGGGGSPGVKPAGFPSLARFGISFVLIYPWFSIMVGAILIHVV